jgi:Predicted redox protein, regulator of disulfide bond formation
MRNTHQHGIDPDPDLFLDISGEVCPLTFVRTKLLIERMKPGEIAEIRLQGSEPLRNVPRAVTGLGHAVLSLFPEPDTTGAHGPHRLRIRKHAG